MSGDKWMTGGGFSAPGIGEREIPWPTSFRRLAANPTCATCGGRMRGARKCDCEQPDWRVKGVKWDPVSGMDDEPPEGELPDPAHEADDVLLYLGDSVKVMRAMPARSVDAVVSDPPYGLEFMGNDWDSGLALAESVGVGEQFVEPGDRSIIASGPAFRRTPLKALQAFEAWTEAWAREAYRVLKPGGWLIAFSGTRTYHRTAAGVEDAGFEVRDQIHWLYGSGFPKNHNIALAIDRELGVESETETVVRVVEATLLEEGGEVEEAATRTSGIGTAFDAENGTWAQGESQTFAVKVPASDEGKQWAGWGTALKPGHEPCVLARKPFVSTVAKNVLKHGVGGLNINGASIGTGDEEVSAGLSDPANRRGLGAEMYGTDKDKAVNNAAQMASLERTNEYGRWPANLVVSHSADCKPLGSSTKRGDGHYPKGKMSGFGELGGGEREYDGPGPSGMEEGVELYECAPDCPVLAIDRQAKTVEGRLGVGGAGPSRYFYVPKPSAAEKDAGLTAEEFPPTKQQDATHPPEGPGANNPRNRSAKPRLNNHPTVKPVELMRYLVRLVTPPGGVVLDPFMGSGTTGCAAVLEGMRFVGVDQDENSVRLARARVEHWRPNQAALF